MLYISFDPTQMEFSHQQWQLLFWCENSEASSVGNESRNAWCQKLPPQTHHRGLSRDNHGLPFPRKIRPAISREKLSCIGEVGPSLLPPHLRRAFAWKEQRHGLGHQTNRPWHSMVVSNLYSRVGGEAWTKKNGTCLKATYSQVFLVAFLGGCFF